VQREKVELFWNWNEEEMVRCRLGFLSLVVPKKIHFSQQSFFTIELTINTIPSIQLITRSEKDQVRKENALLEQINF
jgi:hypothetical protein